jgi:uncharacterized C2H2 Zn-finger protein
MSIMETEGDKLIEQWYALAEKIGRTAFPALRVEEITDDGETYDALRCPRCGDLVDGDELAAVDQSIRWNYARPIDMDDKGMIFDGGGYSDYGHTLYYLHNDDHAVSLPEGWTEEWT